MPPNCTGKENKEVVITYFDRRTRTLINPRCSCGPANVVVIWDVDSGIFDQRIRRHQPEAGWVNGHDRPLFRTRIWVTPRVYRLQRRYPELDDSRVSRRVDLPPTALVRVKNQPHAMSGVVGVTQKCA